MKISTDDLIESIELKLSEELPYGSSALRKIEIAFDSLFEMEKVYLNGDSKDRHLGLFIQIIRNRLEMYIIDYESSLEQDLLLLPTALEKLVVVRHESLKALEFIKPRHETRLKYHAEIESIRERIRQYLLERARDLEHLEVPLEEIRKQTQPDHSKVIEIPQESIKTRLSNRRAAILLRYVFSKAGAKYDNIALARLIQKLTGANIDNFRKLISDPFSRVNQGDIDTDLKIVSDELHLVGLPISPENLAMEFPISQIVKNQ